MPDADPSSPDPHGAATLGQSLQQYGRGIVGGLLFAMPLLFTLEVWEQGMRFSPLRLLAGLAATYALLLVYNRYVGLRANAHPAEVWIDSVEELGLGLVVSAGLLALLGRLDAEVLRGTGLGLVVLAGMAVAVGVAVGAAQLGTSTPDAQGQAGDERRPPSLASDLGLSLCGGVLLALSMAPTDEGTILAAEASRANLVGLAALGLVLCGGALFFTDFHGSRSRRDRTLAHLVRGSVDTYAVALVASGFLLWFLGFFDGAAPRTIAARTLVLALPAALGASAGRLLLRPDTPGDEDDAPAPPASPASPMSPPPATNGPATNSLAKNGLAKNGLEWTVFAASLALLALVVGTVVRGSSVADTGPPRLRVELGAPVPVDDGRVRVPVTLVHEGGQTVESASVEVGDSVRTVTVDFGYTPRDARLEAAALVDAPQGPLEARGVAYALP